MLSLTATNGVSGLPVVALLSSRNACPWTFVTIIGPAITISSPRPPGRSTVPLRNVFPSSSTRCAAAIGPPRHSKEVFS
ncbi:hypothetical protein D3C86_2141800 [compost metagenome]